VHVEKILAWAKERVDWPLEKWMTVVFSDESRFTVEGNDGGEHVLRPVGARYHPKYVHQKTKFGGGSVMVWACFWGGGFGPLVVVDGNMDQVKYVNTLSEHFLPWFQKLQEQHDDKLIFQEDGATCHTASYTQWWKKRWEIGGFEYWPAQSPDLNPIENLWAIIKKELEKYRSKIKNTKDLLFYIKRIWNELTLDLAHKLVSSMGNRCQEVIDAEGFYTHY
jgi:hypothetical protein